MDWTTVLETARDIASRPLLVIGGTPISLITVGVVLCIIIFAFWLSRILQRGVVRALRRSRVDQGTTATIQRLLHYSIMAVGIGVALETVGINLTTLFAAGAVVAVAVGFAMQNILQNFVSGVILLVERSITPSDILEVDGRFVRVEAMRTRSTVARTLDDEQLIIPNSSLVQSTVTNYTLNDSYYRIRILVGVAYSSDVDAVIPTLASAAEGVVGRALEKAPVVLLSEFGDSSIVFEVSVWIDDPWHARRVRSAVQVAIWRALKEAGITIAFPQLDVHFDPEVVTHLAPTRRSA